MKKAHILVAIAVVVLSLSACGGTQTADDSTSPDKITADLLAAVAASTPTDDTAGTGLTDTLNNPKVLGEQVVKDYAAQHDGLTATWAACSYSGSQVFDCQIAIKNTDTRDYKQFIVSRDGQQYTAKNS